MQRAKNPDWWFASATMHHVEDFAILMGAENVAFLGKDDKALIPLGIPAANKQTPILMSMEYPVTLPDHTFVVASKHKLIPSIFASREIKESGLTYSGPTHAAIRSLKHDKSDAFAGFDDLNHILLLDNFKPFLKQEDGTIKPIWIFTRGGHDGPRFPTTRQALIKFFKENDIDYVIAVCNANGLSAHQFIERRMAPLSKELAGIVLPHDTFGSHLDGSGNTTDSEMELNNFRKEGKVLADIWSAAKIDDYPVSAAWVDPSGNATDFKMFSDKKLGRKWLENHVRISKYCLQIAKCTDNECCKPLMTNVQEILSGKFLPTPLVLNSGPSLLDPTDKNEKCKIATFYKSFALRHLRSHGYRDCDVLPYDLYCPSTDISNYDYVCPYIKCQKICTTKELLKLHLKATLHHSYGNSTNEEKTQEEEEEEGQRMHISDGPCIINDLNKFMESTWDITYE